MASERLRAVDEGDRGARSEVGDGQGPREGACRGFGGEAPESSNAWWDAHWIQDRILRKLREASGDRKSVV